MKVLNGSITIKQSLKCYKHNRCVTTQDSLQRFSKVTKIKNVTVQLKINVMGTVWRWAREMRAIKHIMQQSVIFTIFSGTSLLLPAEQRWDTSCKCYTTALCRDSVGSAVACLKMWQIGLHRDPGVSHCHPTLSLCNKLATSSRFIHPLPKESRDWLQWRWVEVEVLRKNPVGWMNCTNKVITSYHFDLPAGSELLPFSSHNGHRLCMLFNCQLQWNSAAMTALKSNSIVLETQQCRKKKKKRKKTSYSMPSKVSLYPVG